VLDFIPVVDDSPSNYLHHDYWGEKRKKVKLANNCGDFGELDTIFTPSRPEENVAVKPFYRHSLSSTVLKFW